MDRIRMRLAGSNEVVTSPAGMDEMQAVRWLARLYHSAADRVINRIGPDDYAVGNGLRGVAWRGTVISVVRAEI